MKHLLGQEGDAETHHEEREKAEEAAEGSPDHGEVPKVKLAHFAVPHRRFLHQPVEDVVETQE